MTTDYDDDDVSSDLKPTFLNPTDFPEGTSQTFRIAKTEKRIYDDGARRTLIFHDDQCLSLNDGNLRLVAKWFGPRTSGWIGKNVTVYRDPSVMHEGERKGGWKLRLPAQDEVPLLDTELTSDDVPF